MKNAREVKKYLFKYVIFVLIFTGVVWYVAWSNVENLKAKGFTFSEKPPVLDGQYFSKKYLSEAEPVPQSKENPTSENLPVKFQKEAVIQAINESMKGGKLENQGAAFYKAYEKWGVSAMMMAAICFLETRTQIGGKWIAGTSKLIKDANNVAGINWDAKMQIRTGGAGKTEWIKNPYQKHGWYNKYISVEESIDDMAKRLRWWYLDMGKLDITKIQKKWAPDNDPRNGIANMDNSAWNAGVTMYYNQMLKRVLEIQGGK